MGLSIYYNAKLKSPSALSELVEEVTDIVEAHSWKYTVFETQMLSKKFNENVKDLIYGICFSPPKCESICLTFLSNGQLVSPWIFEMQRKNGSTISYGTCTKTQYAGEKTHLIIIDLFRHLNKKYFSEFKLIDEGQYWETSDKKILHGNFSRYNALMDSFGLALDTIPIKTRESPEKYLLRIMEEISAKKKKK